MSATVEGWPATINVYLLNEKDNAVLSVEVISPGVKDRTYTMKWAPSSYYNPFPCWRFLKPAKGLPSIPDEIQELEEVISDKVVNIHL